MTDINKTILEKAAGPTRFNPDEQRRFLETYEERVIASCTLEEARDKMYLEQYSTILTDISDRFHPVLIKISPASISLTISIIVTPASSSPLIRA